PPHRRHPDFLPVIPLVRNYPARLRVRPSRLCRRQQRSGGPLFRRAGRARQVGFVRWLGLCGGARRNSICCPIGIGARRHGGGVRTRRHHRGASGRGQHFWRQGQSGRRRPFAPCHFEPSQRDGSCRHHRQHPERRDRGASHPLGGDPDYVARPTQQMERERNMRKLLMGAAALALLAALPQHARAQDAMATPGKAVSMVLLPKFLGILPFDQAHKGAEEAAKELKNPTPLQFLGPTPQNSVAGQIEIVTNATTQGVKAIMISNNSGDQIVPAAKAAQAKGLKVVTWDSPIPSSEGEDVFVAQVDFSDIGKVMADMTLDLTGPGGGKFAILSASPDAANQNAWIAAMKTALKDPKYAKLNLVDTVYGNDESEKSYTQAQALVDKYPDLKVIMAPTSVGIVAAAKALQDEKLCDKVKISGLGLPSELLAYTKNGCAPEFALWSFVDLGYLTYYTAYLLATDAMKAEEGAKFKAGRMGEFTIAKDPTRAKGLRVLMGPFTVYNKENIEAAAK